MDTSSHSELNTRIRQQEVVAELGQQALEEDDLDQLMHDAAVAVAETLDNEYCKVLELLPDGDEVFLRHGVGWQEGYVGNATVPTDLDTQAGYTLISEEPIIVEDLETESRFSGPDLLVDHDVVSGISVIIGSVEEPWGVLGTHTTKHREFTEHDANFVQNVANILASAIENEQVHSELELFRNLIDHSTDSILVIDPDTGEFLDANDTACRRLGYEQDELLDLSVLDIEEGLSDLDAWRAHVEEVRGTNGVTFQGEHKRADGSTFPVEVNVTYAALESGYMLAVARDVSEGREQQRKLRESERRYRALAESFPNGAVTLFDEDLRYTLAAGEAFDYLPVSPSDFENRTPREVWGNDVADALNPILEATLDGEGDTIELSYEGREWIVHAVPITDENGNVFAGMTMAQDITEQKEYERALETSNDRLERYKEYTDDILNAVDDVFYLLDTNGVLQRWNETLCEVTGYSDDEVASMQALDFFDESDQKIIADAIAEGFQTGRVQVEAEVLTKDDEQIPYEFVASTLEDPEGTPVLAGIGRDVTERLEREQKLEKSERRYRTLAENFPSGAVGVYDHDLRYTLTEGTVLGDTLPSADHLEGDRMPEIFPEDTVADLEPLFRAAIEEGETGSTTTKFGGRHWRVWAAPLRGADDDIFAGLSFAQDITEQVEREQQLEESNERLEQFAYAASHDLQEPLRMVSSYLQLLERRYDDVLDEDGHEFIDFAVDGADRMRTMIDGLLQYSRVDTRGDSFEPVELDEILADARKDLQVKIDESNAEITTEPLPSVEGDAGQLRQVFQNLLDNAIEYSGEEPPEIHIDAEREGAKWMISVTDNGIGIEPDDADRVFEVFQSLHTLEEHSGTGIGLALCERIIERHGGNIWVESEPGEGATFSFTLLVQVIAMNEIRGSTKSVDILLVEDNPGDVRLTQEAFSEGGIDSTLHVVTGGVEALDFLHQRGNFLHVPCPDIILLDLNLPRKNGDVVLSEIRDDPDLSRIPVVVLTSSKAEEDVIRSYELHANAYLTKPVDPDEFVETVKTFEEFWLMNVQFPPC